MFDDLDVQCTVLLNCPGLTLSELGTRFIYGFWPVLLHSIFWPVLLRSIFWPVLLRSIFWVFGAPPPHHRNHFPRHDVCATALLCHLFGLFNMARSRTKGKILHVHTSTCGTSSYVQIKNIKRLRYGDWHHFAKEDHACHLDFLILRTSTSSMKSSYDLTLFFFTGMTLSLHKSEGKLRQYHKKGRKVI